MRFTCTGARRALVLALVLVMSSCVTHGVRTTPGALGLADALQPSARRDTYESQAATTLYQVQERGQGAAQGEGEAEAEEKTRNVSAATGSRLPDCTHACGPCAPCKRVMVSFRCAEAAESCPVAYRCMCRGRFFRVPTL